MSSGHLRMVNLSIISGLSWSFILRLESIRSLLLQLISHILVSLIIKTWRLILIHWLILFKNLSLNTFWLTNSRYVHLNLILHSWSQFKTISSFLQKILRHHLYFMWILDLSTTKCQTIIVFIMNIYGQLLCITLCILFSFQCI